MAGYKMKTSQAVRNCQNLDNVASALSIPDRMVSIRHMMAVVDIAVSVAKLAVLGGSTALEALGHMRQWSGWCDVHAMWWIHKLKGLLPIILVCGFLTDGGIFIHADLVLLRDAEAVTDLVEGAIAVGPGYRQYLSGWYNIQWLLCQWKYLFLILLVMTLGDSVDMMLQNASNMYLMTMINVDWQVDVGESQRCLGWRKEVHGSLLRLR
jgi:hypothetical protein